MCKKEELDFSVFLIHQLSYAWNKTPGNVYEIVNKTGILDNYIIRCYDVLHTMGEQYLVNDITDFVSNLSVLRQKLLDICVYVCCAV